MKKKIITVSIIIASILLVIVGIVFIYLGDYYKAVDVDSYLKSDNLVNVKEIDDGYYFDGFGKEEALIFYPGAKVDTKAYAPLMSMIAKTGVDCFLIDMPFHFAVFDADAAEDIIEDYNYKSYYLGGHSLGGAMAANYAADNLSKIKGLLLLAAYPSKSLVDSNLSVVSVYGSNDGVLNMKKMEKAKKLMPSDYIEHVIDGGNHANFASYGSQRKDNEATISKEEQWLETLACMEMLRK